jgi:hypothetical protein
MINVIISEGVVILKTKTKSNFGENFISKVYLLNNNTTG